MAIQAQLCSENIGLPLCGSQDWVETFCGFNDSSFLQQKQNQFQSEQFKQLQNHQFVNNINVSNSVQLSSMAFSQSIAAQVENQRQEIDQYIRLQNERLRLVLQEQRRRQLAALIKKIESKAMVVFNQKDEELARAGKRRMELEDFMRKLEMENQEWQRIAKENELIAVSLNNELEQIKENNCNFLKSSEEDAESCCEVNMETGGNRGINCCGEEDEEWMNLCKGCNSRNSCVLFLPCRHLCSCKACETFLDSCPVCRTVKKATIDVLIS